MRREGRREEKEERKGGSPLSSVLLYELRKVDAGKLAEALKVVHLYHRI